MNKINISLPEIKIVGISARTSNINESDSSKAKILPTMQKFFLNNLSSNITHQKNKNKLFSCYANYESDFNGDYTYFIGSEVSDVTALNNNLEYIIIPEQTYIKFTSDAGKMPDIVINLWQKIWSMNSTELGGERSYITDFEIYDERSSDPSNAIVDIYIGIKN